MARTPIFNASNAASFGRIGGKASGEARRRAKEERRALLLQARILLASNHEETRRQRTLAQLDVLDGLIDDALERGAETAFVRLAAVKSRLWSLVQPTAGVLKPRRNERQAAPVIEVEPTPAPLPDVSAPNPTPKTG